MEGEISWSCGIEWATFRPARWLVRGYTIANLRHLLPDVCGASAAGRLLSSRASRASSAAYPVPVSRRAWHAEEEAMRPSLRPASLEDAEAAASTACVGEGMRSSDFKQMLGVRANSFLLPRRMLRLL